MVTEVAEREVTARGSQDGLLLWAGPERGILTASRAEGGPRLCVRKSGDRSGLQASHTVTCQLGG